MKIDEFRKLTKKGSKYRNSKTDYNGVVYDSKLEARYAECLDMFKKISDPHVGVRRWYGQVRYPIEINGIKVCTYIADFLIEYKDGHKAVHDVKGVRTDVYILKKKLMRAVYGIDVVEITKDDLKNI